MEKHDTYQMEVSGRRLSNDILAGDLDKARRTALRVADSLRKLWEAADIFQKDLELRELKWMDAFEQVSGHSPPVELMDFVTHLAYFLAQERLYWTEEGENLECCDTALAATRQQPAMLLPWSATSCALLATDISMDVAWDLRAKAGIAAAEAIALEMGLGDENFYLYAGRHFVPLHQRADFQALLPQIACTDLSGWLHSALHELRPFWLEHEINVEFARAAAFRLSLNLKSPPRQVVNDAARIARDEWIYEQYCKGVAYKEILTKLASIKKWLHLRIRRKQGIWDVVQRHCRRNGLSLPTRRYDNSP